MALAADGSHPPGSHKRPIPLTSRVLRLQEAQHLLLLPTCFLRYRAVFGNTHAGGRAVRLPCSGPAANSPDRFCGNPIIADLVQAGRRSR